MRKRSRGFWTLLVKVPSRETSEEAFRSATRGTRTSSNQSFALSTPVRGKGVCTQEGLVWAAGIIKGAHGAREGESWQDW